MRFQLLFVYFHDKLKSTAIVSVPWWELENLIKFQGPSTSTTHRRTFVKVLQPIKRNSKIDRKFLATQKSVSSLEFKNTSVVENPSTRMATRRLKRT